jgi:proteasome lid subunit RPN8/RPN11
MTVTIPSEIYAAMIAHAKAELPNECCGFLVGGDRIERALPLRNALASPVAYSVEPKDLLRVQRELRSEGSDVWAVYHSHPTSASIPSVSDLAKNGYGETIPHVIIGMARGEADVRAWILGEVSFREVEIQIG